MFKRTTSLNTWLTLINPGCMTVGELVFRGCGTPFPAVAWVLWQLKQFGNDVAPWVKDSIAVLDIASSPPVMEWVLSEPFRMISGSVWSLTRTLLTLTVPGLPVDGAMLFGSGKSCQTAPTRR